MPIIGSPGAFSGVTVPPDQVHPSGNLPTIPTGLPPGAQGITANYDELFASLLGLRWRDVWLPYVRLTTNIRQDLVIHKFVDRDGAHIEATGRAPLEISARLPLINGLQAARNEGWGKGNNQNSAQKDLYPSTWRLLVKAVADKSSGQLQHPELGNINCKCERMETVWDGGIRFGVFVDIVWIETDDSATDNTAANLSQISPLANLSAAAADLVALGGQINPAVIPQPYQPPLDFGALAFAVRGVSDQITLTQKSFAGRLDNLYAQAQSLQDSLTNIAANANPTNWPIWHAAENMKAAVNDTKATQLNKQRAIGFYKVLKDSTLAQVANTLGQNLTDIMQLNPVYLQLSLVPAGATVRFYV